MGTDRLGELARIFGRGLVRDSREAWFVPEVALSAGSIVLITGASGGGKSTLLRVLRRRCRRRGVKWIDVWAMRLANRPVIELFDQLSVEDAVRLLASMGLGEWRICADRPKELSEGQRFRLRLALAIAEARRDSSAELVVLGCDEFGAVLDRVTAAVVARALRRVIGRMGNVCAVVATSAGDLAGALSLQLVVRCDFGQTSVRLPAEQSTQNVYQQY